MGLRQVLGNLFTNALDAMKAQEKLYVRTWEAKDWTTGQRGLTLIVADSGGGMPPEVLSRAFEPFFTTKGIRGTGLGLWISADIVRRHHGTLRVRSSNRETRHGAVFRVFLPYGVRPERSAALE